MKHSRLVAVATAYAVLLALVVLAPIGPGLNRLTVRMYVVWTYRLHLPGGLVPDDFGLLLNVLLFVPVGVLVSLLLRRTWWQSVVLCLLGSTLIELTQWVLPLHRVASVSDVVTNTLGGLLGATAVVLVRRRRRAGAPERTPVVALRDPDR